jgi:hypothetical protein
MTAPGEYGVCPDHRPAPGRVTAVVDVGGYYGRPETVVDEEQVNRLVAAALVRCVQCQSHALDAIDSQPVTVASVLDRAVYVVIKTCGGVPGFLTDATAVSGYSLPTRMAIGAAVGRPGGPAALFEVVESCSPEQRREIALDALHMLVGYFSLSPDAIAGVMTKGRERR